MISDQERFPNLRSCNLKGTLRDQDRARFQSRCDATKRDFVAWRGLGCVAEDYS